MNSEKLTALRIAVNQFYLNKYQDHPEMSDIEYDSLVKDYESEGGSVKDLIEWEKGEKVENDLKIGLNKIAVSDNNLSRAVIDHRCKNGINDYYCNLKYDGCAIIGIYKDGKLKQVRSTPDEKYGIIRTKAFWNLFPHELEDKSIVALQGEALVDYSAYGQKARNKANGLVNSVNMDSEVENEIFVRIYRVYFSDEESFNFNRSLTALKSLPSIIRARQRQGVNHEDTVFCAAEQFTAAECPTEALVSTDSGNFQCDGVVMYSEQGPLGFKFYFTESAITTVTKIEWCYQLNGSYMPKVKFDRVRLNDKNISQAASGGLPNLRAKKMGVGAKVRVILSKMTIPKIIEVLEPSEDYQYPTCQCGYHLSEKDTFGSVIKCGNTECCSKNYNTWSKLVSSKLESFQKQFDTQDNIESFRVNPYTILNIALQIDRWDAHKMKKVTLTGEIFSELLNIIDSEDINRFRDFITLRFRMSDLNKKNFIRNLPTSLKVLHDNLIK